MERQPVESQRGEIEFRRKLVQQQVEGRSCLADEFDGQGIEAILRERISQTLDHMSLLKQNGVSLSPYLEIGAERCQRSLAMENDLGASGAAVDISADMLRSCVYYSNVFQKSKIPLRVCCDANTLPFMSDSIPFVFCYETLHHFPDPALIIREVFRILSPGGWFFFHGEPYKRMLHVALYRGRKIYSQASLRRSALMRIVDYFFAELSCNEQDHGVIENHDIPIHRWRSALDCFTEKRIRLQSPIRRIESEFPRPRSSLKFLLASLLGGELSGLVRKAGIPEFRQLPIEHGLICPSCMERGCESQLYQGELALSCEICGGTSPIIDGVRFLFPHERGVELYPEILGGASAREKAGDRGRVPEGV